MLQSDGRLQQEQLLWAVFVSKESATVALGAVAPPKTTFLLQIFQCTVANISMQGKEIFQCRAKKYFNAEQRNISMQSKEAVSGSLSGATQELDSGDWTQLFPHSTHLCSAVLQAENI